MDSFYGGKQGISFIIKDRFNSINDMLSAFGDETYTQTWYHEYCIIDTPQKNNIDNGKVYQRTAYRANAKKPDEIFAEYVGQIIGPAGGIPNIELKDITTLKNNFDILATSIDTRTPAGTIYYKNTANSYAQTVTKGEGAGDKYSDNLYITDESIASSNIIYKSGKDYAAGETPAFKYGFYTFQPTTSTDSNNTIIPTATLGIGFEIPYVDFADPTITMLPYNSAASIDVITDDNNDFLYQYDFKIPGGAPGYHFVNVQPMQIKIRDNEYESLITANDRNKTFVFVENNEEIKCHIAEDLMSINILDDLNKETGQIIFKGGQLVKEKYNDGGTIKYRMRLFSKPDIYNINAIDYVPNRKDALDQDIPDYQIKTGSTPITNFKTITVLVCQIEYPNTDNIQVNGTTPPWLISNEWFYLADIPGIQKAYSGYDYASNNYRLYIKYDGWDGPITIYDQQEQPILTGAYDVGIVGPDKLGMWVIYLQGELHIPDENDEWDPYIEITSPSTPPTQLSGEGNLGVLSTNSLLPAELESDEREKYINVLSQLGYGANQTIYYIWYKDVTNQEDNGQWLPIGLNSSTNANIEVTLATSGFMNIQGANSTVYLFADSMPSSNQNINKFEATPWK